MRYPISYKNANLVNGEVTLKHLGKALYNFKLL